MTKRLITFGSVFVALWGFIAWMSHGLPAGLCRIVDRLTIDHWSVEILKMANGFHYPVANNDMPTIAFLIVFAVIFFLYLNVVRICERNLIDTPSLVAILTFAVLLRIILLLSVPIHENDIYRYLWDGKSAVHGVNPFKYAPADLFMHEEGYREDYQDPYRDVTIKAKEFSFQDQPRLELLTRLRDQNRTAYDRIGHWQVPTIYPPVAQAVFFFSTLLKQDSIVIMKCVFVLFDLGVIMLIILLLKHFKLNPGLSVIYAWSPLVLKEVPNAGHYDPVAIFFTMLALLFFCQNKVKLSVFHLTLAALAKYFSIILLPFIWRSMKKRYLAIMLIVSALAFGPFVFWNQTGMGGVFEGLTTYNKEWFYNASLFALLKVSFSRIFPAMADQLMIPKMLIGCGYVSFLVYLYRREAVGGPGLLHNCLLATAGLFFISPVGDPWYFCWTIPFLCFFPYRSLLYCSGLLMLSYLNFHSDIAWINQRIYDITVLNWLIYLPVFLVILVEVTKRQNFWEKNSVVHE